MKTKLHPGARWLFRLRAYFSFLLLVFVFFWLAGFLVFLLKAGVSFLVWVLVYVILVIIISEIFTQMSYNRWFYEFTATNLKMERGIIWKRYSNVPYERVQNVDIQRGIFARILGFSTVMIQTAGYSAGGGRRGVGAEGYIPAVEAKEAERIRDFLMKKISKKSGQGL